MERKITEIYKEYKIMPNLQDHMFRVAAVAAIICDNFSEPLPKKQIVAACLLHDMGNIIKSNFEFLPEFLEPEGLAYWQKVKDEFIEKYGIDEEKAHGQILLELGVSPKIISLVSQIDFALLCKHKDSDDVILKIINYADGRVSPYGVVSYDERMEEACKRYQHILNSKHTEEGRRKLVACGKETESQIFAKCKIKPEDIDDQTVAPIISELRNFVIHSIKTQDHGE